MGHKIIEVLNRVQFTSNIRGVPVRTITGSVNAPDEQPSPRQGYDHHQFSLVASDCTKAAIVLP